MNYSLTFKSDYGNTCEIATIKPLDKSGQIKSDNEILQEALALINAFCEDRSFRIYYTRIWNRDDTTIFDVGSHTEFFYLTPKIDLSD
jgi:hypothetical protein